jgi:hypothetical protein
MNTPCRTHITRTKTARNSDGSFKTIDQILRSTLKLADYGKYLAAQQRSN